MNNGESEKIHNGSGDTRASIRFSQSRGYAGGIPLPTPSWFSLDNNLGIQSSSRDELRDVGSARGDGMEIIVRRGSESESLGLGASRVIEEKKEEGEKE